MPLFEVGLPFQRIDQLARSLRVADATAIGSMQRDRRSYRATHIAHDTRRQHETDHMISQKDSSNADVFVSQRKTEPASKLVVAGRIHLYRQGRDKSKEPGLVANLLLLEQV